MGKKEDIRELSADIYADRSTMSQMYGLVSMLVIISQGTKYEYDVFEAVKAYNNVAEWNNRTGQNSYPVFDLPELKDDHEM